MSKLFSLDCLVKCQTVTCKNYGIDIVAKIFFVEGKEPRAICGLCCAPVSEIIPTSEPVEVTN